MAEVREEQQAGRVDECAARLDRIGALLAERDRVDRTLSVELSEAELTGAWAAAGALGGRTFLRSTGGRSGDGVRDVLGLARLVTGFATTKDALLDGSLGTPHARALAGTVRGPRRAMYRRDEAVLLAQAAVLPIADFEILLRHWGALVDQETGEPAEVPRQRLHVQGRFDGGCDLRGSLDELTTASVCAALDAYDTGPDPVGAPIVRTLAERRADALGDVADAACGPGVAPVGPPPDAETETRDRGAGPGRADQPGPPPTPAPAPAPHPTPPRPPQRPRTTNIVIDVRSLAGRDADDLDGIVAEIDGHPVAARAVEALLCESWVAAVVVGARGAVVDATERVGDFTATQKRLLAVRDRGCAFPGCDRPPSWCDAHHLTPRATGGTNGLENGVLLCRRHHRLLHHGWSLARGPDGTWQATDPHGRTWPGRPPPAHALAA